MREQKKYYIFYHSQIGALKGCTNYNQKGACQICFQQIQVPLIYTIMPLALGPFLWGEDHGMKFSHIGPKGYILQPYQVQWDYQPVLWLIANNYNYLSHALFHLLNISTHTLKYVFIIIQLQQISFCITPPCVFDIYLIELFVCALVFLCLPLYMNI